MNIADMDMNLAEVVHDNKLHEKLIEEKINLFFNEKTDKDLLIDNFCQINFNIILGVAGVYLEKEHYGVEYISPDDDKDNVVISSHASDRVDAASQKEDFFDNNNEDQLQMV